MSTKWTMTSSNILVLQWSLCVLLLFSSDGGYGGGGGKTGRRGEGGVVASQGGVPRFAFAQVSPPLSDATSSIPTMPVNASDASSASAPSPPLAAVGSDLPPLQSESSPLVISEALSPPSNLSEQSAPSTSIGSLQAPSSLSEPPPSPPGEGGASNASEPLPIGTLQAPPSLSQPPPAEGGASNASEPLPIGINGSDPLPPDSQSPPSIVSPSPSSPSILSLPAEGGTSNASEPLPIGINGSDPLPPDSQSPPSIVSPLPSSPSTLSEPSAPAQAPSSLSQSPPFSPSTLPPSTNGSTSSVGVNIGFGQSSQPINASEIITILREVNATSVKLFGDENDTPEVVEFFTAIAGTGIDVVISTSAEQMLLFADNLNNETTAFVLSKILSRPGVKISAIAVGNEVLRPDIAPLYWERLVPAMMNLQLALEGAGLGQIVKLVSPMNLNVFNVTYPPSSGMFNDSYLPVITQLLQFLNSTGSSFMVNLFPFLPTKNYPTFLALALGDPEAERVPDNGLEYANMVDMMVDAVAYGLEREGFSSLPISIGAVGWPTEGDLIATTENAEKFNNYLVRNLLSGRGTPKRLGAAGQMHAYIFELLDEDNKTVTPENYLFEYHWGIRFMNGTAKYNIDLSQGWPEVMPSTPLDSSSPPSPVSAVTPPLATLPSVPATLPSLPTASIPTTPANVSVPAIDPACIPGGRGGYPRSANPVIGETGGPGTYCVVNDCASDTVIEDGQRWACGAANGLDCGPIQPGGPCFVNSTIALASWAFNLRYVNQSRAKGSCYFGGSGMIIDVNPSLGLCIYP